MIQRLIEHLKAKGYRVEERVPDHDPFPREHHWAVKVLNGPSLIVKDTEEEQPEALVWCLKELERRDTLRWCLMPDRMRIDLKQIGYSCNGYRAKTMTAAAIQALCSLPKEPQDGGG